MNELLKINYEAEQPTVSARDLHEALEINTRFNDWFSRMAEYGFENGVDFNLLKNEKVRLEGNREVKRDIMDYQISVDMAKQICMIQRSEKGMEHPGADLRPRPENGRSEDREAERNQRRSAGRCRAHASEGNLRGCGESKHQFHPDRRSRKAPAPERRGHWTEKIVRTAS